MNCLWCDKEINRKISWKNAFILFEQHTLCKNCHSYLEVIEGNRCSKCSRKSTKIICSDCKLWESNIFMHTGINFNHSIYTYNDGISEIVAKWKYRGDYVLATIFKSTFVRVFKNTFSHLLADAIVVPIPLSNKRYKARGFNQAKALADFLPIPSDNILTRMHGEKQSKKTRTERLSLTNPFIIKKEINKPVILVDDIYTTGTTVRHAGSLLKEHGCPNVYAYTLIRG